MTAKMLEVSEALTDFLRGGIEQRDLNGKSRSVNTMLLSATGETYRRSGVSAKKTERSSTPTTGSTQRLTGYVLHTPTRHYADTPLRRHADTFLHPPTRFS
jgi:hypothetical protein